MCRQFRGAWSLVVIALLGTGLAPMPLAAQQPTLRPGATLVLDGVTVIDVEQGRRLESQRVVVAGNRITAVGSARTVALPKDARVVDARGQYVIPGLWDMHTHIARETDVFYAFFIAAGVTGVLDAASDVPLDTLRFWRQEILARRRVGPPRLLFGPSIDLASIGCKEAVRDGFQFGRSRICVTTPAEARRAVDSVRKAGADLLKVYYIMTSGFGAGINASPEERAGWRAKGVALYAAVAAEARRVGLPFGGIRAPDLSAAQTSDSGARLIDRVEALAPACWGDAATVEACRPVAERFQGNDTWWVPTLGRAENRGWDQPEGTRSKQVSMRFDDAMAAFWADRAPTPDAALRLSGEAVRIERSGASPFLSVADSAGYLAVAQRVGLPILAGAEVGSFSHSPGASASKPSSTSGRVRVPTTNRSGGRKGVPPGLALHQELEMYVAEGLTPLAALQAATLNPAKFLHATDSLGTVAPGKLADLVLLDADPLADIANTTRIRAVIANGRYFDRAALDRMIMTVKGAAAMMLP